MIHPKYVGLLACSGEDLPEGTLTRMATRLVLDELLPMVATVICVPLFLTGDSQEVNFVARNPCVVIDGCEKACIQTYLSRVNTQKILTLQIQNLFLPKDLIVIRQLGRHDHIWQSHPFTKKLAEIIATAVLQLGENDLY